MCTADDLQCDEIRPQCKKCLLFGVECNYGGTTKTLQLAGQGAFQLEFAPVPPTEHVIDFSDAAPALEQSDMSTAAQRPERHPDQAYGAVASTISPSYSNTATVAATQPWSHPSTPYTPVSTTSTIASMIDNSLQLDFSASDMLPTTGSAFIAPVSFWHFSEAHLEILARFRDRTALSIGDKTLAPAYRDVLCQLAMTVCQHYSFNLE